MSALGPVMLGGIGWLDALDVLVVAALLYAGLRWARRSEGALVAVGIAIVCAGYGAAAALDLKLTTWSFQGVAALFVVVLAVLFQEELRGAFEGVAAWALGRRQAVRPKLDTTHILVEGLLDLARRRVGALIVLPGVQPLRRHMRGGVQLDGRLSAPLLDSLFDPHSMGHDGAVLVDNRRVTRFGVQLPLSRDGEKIDGLGLRHTAALGLTERTDALCLVVSEERGEVSVARGGVLTPVAGEDELAERIDGFYRETLPLARRRPAWQRLLLEERREKAAALGAAAALWAVLIWRAQPLDLTLEVPVRLENLPAHVALGSVEPARVPARVRGPRHLLLPPHGVALLVDASDAGPGSSELRADAGDLTLPEGLVARPLDVSIRLELGVPPVAAR